jgi:cation:H+ antiporter
MVWNIIAGFSLLLVMVFASGVIVDVVEKLAFRLPVKKQTLSSLLLGISLALPELFVGLAAALDGKSQMALGVVIGANMANLSLVVGGAAFVNRSIPVVGEYLARDLWIVVGLVLLPFFMLTDGVISANEGLLLLVVYFVYAVFVSDEKVIMNQKKQRLVKGEQWLWGAILLLGLLIMASSAWLLVQLTIRVAAFWGVSWFWMGLILVAFGTTLPELLLAFQKKRRVTLLLPSLLGSVVMNSTLVLGIVAIFQPMILYESIQRGISGVFLVVILGLFWLFTKSKRKLERWEGVVMIGVYLMFIGLQFLFA